MRAYAFHLDEEQRELDEDQLAACVFSEVQDHLHLSIRPRGDVLAGWGSTEKLWLACEQL